MARAPLISSTATSNSPSNLNCMGRVRLGCMTGSLFEGNGWRSAIRETAHCGASVANECLLFKEKRLRGNVSATPEYKPLNVKGSLIVYKTSRNKNFSLKHFI